MPERSYLVTFKDGTSIHVKAHDEAQARMRARGKRKMGSRGEAISHVTQQLPRNPDPKSAALEARDRAIRDTPGFKSSSPEAQKRHGFRGSQR
jgi:hypothetical protein